MRFLSLFSGIEAGSVAWKPLGWTCVGVSEIDPFACAVLQHHFPDVPNLGSVTDITKEQLDAIQKDGAIDICLGGSPCQSFSIAGKRGGLSDPRGNLMFEFCRIVKTVSPKWFIWENVPGALSSKAGADFACLLKEMAEFGYACGWRVLDSQYFGVPQRRRRVFLIGCLTDKRGPFKVLFERESIQGDLETSRQTEQGSTTQTQESIGRNDQKQRGIGCDLYNCSVEPDDKCSTLTSQNRQVDGTFIHCSYANYKQSKIGGTLKASGGDYLGGETLVISNATGSGPRIIKETPTVFHSNHRSNPPKEHDKCPTLLGYMGTGGGNVPMTINQTQSEYFYYNQTSADCTGPDEIAGTLLARYGTGGGNVPFVLSSSLEIKQDLDFSITGALLARDYKGVDNFQWLSAQKLIPEITHEIEHNLAGALLARDYKGLCGDDITASSQKIVLEVKKPPTKISTKVRRLTEIECERLQGFPDNWTQIPYRNKPADKCPMSPRYKTLGNSMAVPVIRWLGEGIMLAEGLPIPPKPSKQTKAEYEEVFSICGNIAAGRDAGMNQFGVRSEVSYALNATDVPGVTSLSPKKKD